MAKIADNVAAREYNDLPLRFFPQIFADFFRRYTLIFCAISAPICVDLRAIFFFTDIRRTVLTAGHVYFPAKFIGKKGLAIW